VDSVEVGEMRYYKIINDGYILVVGTGKGNVEITEQEYNEILNVISNMPIAPQGYEYKLKDDLTWELYELPVIVDESEE
jgi:hypothetical protein